MTHDAAVSKAASLLGRKGASSGGKARMRGTTKAYRRELARKAGLASGRARGRK